MSFLTIYLKDVINKIHIRYEDEHDGKVRISFSVDFISVFFSLYSLVSRLLPLVLP